MTERETLSDYEGYNQQNWDGYDGNPITPDVLALARAFAETLQLPLDAAPGGDGTIGFEWVDASASCKIFMDIGPNEISMYARIGETFFQMRSTGKPFNMPRTDGEEPKR